MQKLFSFVPSDTKPDTEFFRSEQCEIIRKYVEKPRGYFVITDEGHDRPQRYMPQAYCTMWWVVKFPMNTRLSKKVRCFKPVTRIDQP